MPGKQFHTIIKNTSIDVYLLSLLLYTSYSMFIVSSYFCHTIFYTWSKGTRGIQRTDILIFNVVYRIFQNTQWLCYKLLIHRRFCFAFILILFLLPLCFLCLSLESWGFVLSSYLQHNGKKTFLSKKGNMICKKVCVYVYVFLWMCDICAR